MAAVVVRKNNQRLLEVSYSTDLQVDWDNGVVKGVKILGRESQHGYTYSDQAMKDAARLYEGIEVNLNHERTKSVRDVNDGFGYLTNTRVREEAVYGDLNFWKSHPFAERFCEIAKRNPNQIGLSHDAYGPMGTQVGGKQVVESLEIVNSVDVVRKAATNAGLFEDLGGEQMTLLQEQGDLLAPELGAMPGEEESVSGAEEVMTAFETAAIKIIKDRTLSPEERADKVKTLLQKSEEAAAEMEGGGDAAPAPPEAPVPESNPGKESLDPNVVRLQETVKRLEGESKAKDLLEAADIAPRPAYVTALVNAKDKAEQTELLEEWPKRASSMHAGRPAQSSPRNRFRESAPGKYPETHDDFLKSIK